MCGSGVAGVHTTLGKHGGVAGTRGKHDVYGRDGGLCGCQKLVFVLQFSSILAADPSWGLFSDDI